MNRIREIKKKLNEIQKLLEGLDYTDKTFKCIFIEDIYSDEIILEMKCYLEYDNIIRLYSNEELNKNLKLIELLLDDEKIEFLDYIIDHKDLKIKINY